MTRTIEQLNNDMVELLKKSLSDPKLEINHVKCADVLLSLESCCEHSDHRIRPDSANDWGAVSRMMALTFQSLCDHTRAVMLLVGKLHELNVEEQIDFHVSRNMLNVEALILRSHYRLLNNYPRRVDGAVMADARTHYERIILKIRAAEIENATNEGQKNAEAKRSSERNEELGKTDRFTFRSRQIH